MRDEAIVRKIVHRICAEFGVSRRDIGMPGKENFLRLMAITLGGELLGLPRQALAKAFEGSLREATLAPKRLWKYLRFIPGLRRRFEKFRRDLKKKLVDFDA